MIGEAEFMLLFMHVHSGITMKTVFQNNTQISVTAFMFQISGMHIQVLVCTINTLYLVAWTKALFCDVLRQIS